MAHNANSVEIERQFWLPEIKPVQDWLKKNATLKYTNHQIDEYFTPEHDNYLAKKYPNEFFRIRNSAGKFSTTYKNWYAIDDKGHHSHCDEFETAIENGEQFRNMLLAMKFTPRIIVDKTRTSFAYKNFEINIDEIKELGSFCEIEIQGKYASIAQALKQIDTFANNIGVLVAKDTPDMTGGYAMMLLRQRAKGLQ